MDLAAAPDRYDTLRVAQAAHVVAPRAKTQVRTISLTEAAEPAFIAGWSALAACAVEPNPFYEPWFLLPSMKAFGLEACVTLFAFYEGDVLCGLMPMARGSSYYRYPLPHIASWLHANAFCGAPLIASGAQDRFWVAMMAHLDASPGTALFAHFQHLPQDGPANAALTRVLDAQGRPAATVQQTSRAMMASDALPADYLASTLSAKHRKDLRRQRRRLADCGDLAVERLGDAQDIAGWAQDYLALESAGWKGEAGTSLGDQGASRDFFIEAITGAASAGRLDRLALTLGGRRIAMLATFRTAPGAYSFKTAYDEQYAAFSPGMLLQIENLATLSDPAISWTDSCAAQGHPMIERIWSERRTMVSRNIAIGGRLRQTIAEPLMAYETRTRAPA